MKIVKIVPVCLMLLLSCSFYAIGNTQERLAIFKLNLVDDSEPKFYFVSVLWGSHIVIYDEEGYKKQSIQPIFSDIDDGYNNYKYQLPPKYRQNFLTASGISETDNLFVYNYEYNKLYSFPISKLDIFALKDDCFPIDETYYHFGFELTLSQLPQNYDPNDTTFVYIGEESPFAQQQLTLLNWQKISDKKYDYLAQAHGLHYYLKQPPFHSNYPVCGSLLIKNEKNKILRNDDHASSLLYGRLPLNGKDKDHEYKKQWTGKLFENKPLVVFGFFSMGGKECPVIDFIDSSFSGHDVNLICYSPPHRCSF